jgi:hypothetical protein
LAARRVSLPSPVGPELSLSAPRVVSSNHVGNSGADKKARIDVQLQETTRRAAVAPTLRNISSPTDI